MPELPEVETIRRSLVDKVKGRRIQGVEILLPRLIKWPSAYEFQALVTGKTILQLDRKGKYLILRLEDNMTLVIHLRMTGRLYFVTNDDKTDRFTHIIFDLGDGAKLLYADTRTLGTLYAMPESELWRIAGLASMGPEPLTQEFSPAYFRGLLAGRKGRIKALLLNQKLIGGLGNIYVDEALAIAGIDPDRLACSLNDEEAALLYEAVNQVIYDGIHHGGTSFRDYRDGEGKSGSHQNYLAVYGRKGQPCRRCGAPIERKEVAGRGTHYCPNCQR